MGKGKHAHSGRRGGKKGRGANTQARRSLLVSDSDDALTRPESVGHMSGDEGGMDEEGEEQHPHGSNVIITVPVAMILTTVIRGDAPGKNWLDNTSSLSYGLALDFGG